MDDRDFKTQLLNQFKLAGIDAELRAKMAERLLKPIKNHSNQIITFERCQGSRRIWRPQIAGKAEYRSEVHPGGESGTPKKATDLKHQLLSSLLVDFMDRKKLGNTKDMFLTEMGNPQTLSPAELENYFGYVPKATMVMHPNSKLFERQQGLSMLERILGQTIYRGTIEKNTRGSQTDEDQHSLSLQRRLTDLDRQFETRSLALVAGTGGSTLGVRLKEMEQNIRLEYDALLKKDMLLFKETEMRNYRIKLDQEFSQSYRQKEMDLEKVYLARLDQVRDRESRLYGVMERKIEELDKGEHTKRREYLLKLTEFDEEEKRIKRERMTRLADVEAKEKQVEEMEKMARIKLRDAEEIRSDLSFNALQLEKRMNSQHIMKNMRAMAEETAETRKRLDETQKSKHVLEDRVDQLTANVEALRLTILGKDTEIRALEDERFDLRSKLRNYENNHVGLLDQIRNQGDTEAFVLHAQKEHLDNLRSLSERYNKVLAENEELRAQIIAERANLESEFKERSERLNSELEALNQERSELVAKSEYESLLAKFQLLETKHRKLLRDQMTKVLDMDVTAKPLREHSAEGNARRTFEFLAEQIAKLKLPSSADTK